MFLLCTFSAFRNFCTSKGQVPWVKILTLKILLGVWSNFCPTNDNCLGFTKWQLFLPKIVIDCLFLSENGCHFVNLLSVASSSFFLRLREITWLNSQQPKTREHYVLMYLKIKTKYKFPSFFTNIWPNNMGLDLLY